jgi:uncharacterized protein YuzE
MPTLLSILPHLVAEVEAALAAEGRAELVTQLASAIILQCSFDQEADAGYIELNRYSPSLHFAKLATPVAETLSFFENHGINIDIDHDGQLFGIELIGRPDIIPKLKEKNML